MARKRSDDLKALAGSWLDAGGADEPAATEPTPAPSAEAIEQARSFLDPEPPVILATAKSRTSSGKLLRRTLYFTPDEWRAVLAAADSDTRRTGERVTAAEIVRRAVRAWLGVGEDEPS